MGGDIVKLVCIVFEEGYFGFEIIGDFCFLKKFYVVVEFGIEIRDWDEDNLKVMIFGSYIKLGVDYNVYNNWIGMNNVIIVGLCYGFVIFFEELMVYFIYIIDIIFLIEIRIDLINYLGFNVSWIEFILGVKIEIFINLYFGINV